MLQVRMLADARRAPLVHIETLSSHKPILTNLFWASRNELKSLTLALRAVVLDSTALEECFVVRLEKMAAEASRSGPDSRALILLLLPTLPSHIDSTLHCLVRMVELPCHHLFGSRSHADLLH